MEHRLVSRRASEDTAESQVDEVLVGRRLADGWLADWLVDGWLGWGLEDVLEVVLVGGQQLAGRR